MCSSGSDGLSEGFQRLEVGALAPLKLREDDGVWQQLGGATLESAMQVDPDLGDSPVKLIDGRFIVKTWKQGGKIVRRQDLPNEAFIDLETLKRLPSGRGTCLRIIAVSHPWQQPDHPDPKEVNLTLLGKVLERFIDHDGEGTTYACFFDFMSCFQKGPDGKRTRFEAALFGKSMSSSMTWYSHPNTVTFKLTKLPDDYPEGFVFPEGVEPNTAGYPDRGWCFCESSVSNLVKDYDFVLDLANFDESMMSLDDVVRGCAAKRVPPLAPAVFWSQLLTKSFTSRNADLEKVGIMYDGTFDERMGAVKNLQCADLQWTDEDDAVRGFRDRQAGEAHFTERRGQPDWRCRRRRARGGGGQAAEAQGTLPPWQPDLPASQGRPCCCPAEL